MSVPVCKCPDCGLPYVGTSEGKRALYIHLRREHGHSISEASNLSYDAAVMFWIDDNKGGNW